MAGNVAPSPVLARSHLRVRAAPLRAAASLPLAAAPSEAAAPRQGDPREAPEDAVARVLRQTVLIEADGTYGAGVVLAPKRGLILTNLHVVEDMKVPRFTLYDGRSGSAKVIESDRALDLALLEGPVLDAPPLPVGDAQDLRPAQTLYSIGSPRKLGFTVSRGIVSYVGRPMDGARYIQTDLAINDGNSGGPVINARGDLVGIMSFILRKTNGLAFALPINYAIERFSARLPPDPNRASYLDRFRVWKTR
jgi:S1-C subfamily serine protease